MKRWSVLASLAAAALVAVGSMNPAMAQKKLKLGSVAPPTIPLGVVLEGTLSEVVKKESNGGLELEVHLRGAICGEQKCGEQSRQGLIAIATSSTANFGNFAPTYASFDLPYIFKNLDSANALAGGWFGKAHHDKAIPDSDFKVWSAFAAGGFRQLGNTKRPVHSPADMKGIKMRVTKSPVEYTFIKEVGAVPVPYDWLQTYQGLQTGVIEGQYVQVPWQEVFKMYEVQPYYTEIGGAWGGNVIYMDNKQYMALSADERKALDTGMAAFDKEIRTLDNKWVEEGVALIKTKIKEWYVPTDAEMVMWQKNAVEAWKGAKGTFDAKLAEKALTEQGMTEFLAALKAGKAL